VGASRDKTQARGRAPREVDRRDQQERERNPERVEGAEKDSQRDSVVYSSALSFPLLSSVKGKNVNEEVKRRIMVTIGFLSVLFLFKEYAASE
jgi:hypothetical protein